jgi:hypothetical protein
LIALTATSGGCDPVHDDAVSALGGETPGVPRGPLHRPGQPCLLCHDGQGTDPTAFSMAGTVFAESSGLSPEVGAVVTLQDASGLTVTATTNAAGNFYLTPSQFSPHYPVHVTSVAVGATTATMHSHIGGNGSCAGCHVDPAGPDSPGHVYFDVGGTSP